jgi:hypothetical protein
MVVAGKRQGLSTTGYQAFIYVVCNARYRKVARVFLWLSEANLFCSDKFIFQFLWHRKLKWERFPKGDPL